MKPTTCPSDRSTAATVWRISPRLDGRSRGPHPFDVPVDPAVVDGAHRHVVHRAARGYVGVGEFVGHLPLPCGQPVAGVGRFSDGRQRGEVGVGQVEAGIGQGQCDLEPGVGKESRAWSRVLGLGDHAASAVLASCRDGRSEQLATDLLSSLGGMDLDVQFGEVALALSGEQAQEGGPDRAAVGV